MKETIQDIAENPNIQLKDDNKMNKEEQHNIRILNEQFEKHFGAK